MRAVFSEGDKKAPSSGEWEGGPKRNKHYPFIIKKSSKTLLFVCVNYVIFFSKYGDILLFVRPPQFYGCLSFFL